MTATWETSYPATLQRDDRRRGRLDGMQRTPALAEVRRQQQELQATGGQLTVGYQAVLLAELSEQLNELRTLYLRKNEAMALELSQYDDRIEQAGREVERMQERVAAATAALTPEELLPRNPEEERWTPATVRNRREVARARRAMRAQEALDNAYDELARHRYERVAVVRRHQESSGGPAIRARRLAELYQRRMAGYLSALAQHHPEGRTLYPLLSMPEIPLPDWVTEKTSDPLDTGSET